jgi:hypothetical protein
VDGDSKVRTQLIRYGTGILLVDYFGRSDFLIVCSATIGDKNYLSLLIVLTTEIQFYTS